MSLSWKLIEKINEGEGIDSNKDYHQWAGRVECFLEAAIDHDVAKRFIRVEGAFDTWRDTISKQLGYLEGLVSSNGGFDEVAKGDAIENMNAKAIQFANTNDIFIVHGHDGEAKEMIARFTERLGLNPIILHEQPNSGMTVIEKFEKYSDVSYAIVLLTPDDVGASVKDKENLKERARQNVILELGYFIGKLGRNRVCALYKGVEIPSDFNGVVYINLDDGGGWKTKVAQELSNARMKIDLEALLQN